MNKRNRTFFGKVTYKKWREEECRAEDVTVGPADELQDTDNDIYTTSTAGVPSGATESTSTSTSTPQSNTFTVDDALEFIGFGMFQWKITLLTGLSWIADSMEMMILSILGPQMHCDWRLPSYKVAFITSVVFVGMSISASLWGKISDKYGRKIGLTLCLCWTLYYGLLSAFVPVYGWLLFIRGLVGFGIGGLPQAVTLYSEFLPLKARGTCIMLISGFWALGAVLEVLLALLVMPTLGWRWLLGLSALPVALCISLSNWLPESPRFDMLAGRREKAMLTLSRIAKENGKCLPPGTLIAFKQDSRGRLTDLFSAQYWRTTLLLWFIWFGNGFSYYGIILLTTELFQAADSCTTVQGAKVEPSCSLECRYLTTADYTDLLWTTLAEFPGLLVVIVIIDRIGRKRSMALCFFLFSLCLLPLYACIGRLFITILIFTARASISSGYQAVFVYTPEVFPTDIRALALGTASTMSRVGAIITPMVAQVMLRTSMYLPLSVYCGCSLLAGVASLVLPIETLGRGLQEASPDRGGGAETGDEGHGQRDTTVPHRLRQKTADPVSCPQTPASEDTAYYGL